MHRTRLIFFVIIILLLSGCTKITNNIDDVVNAALVNNNISANTVSTSYELYIPTGVKQVVDSQYNQKFKIRNRYVYLYVDTVSYYYKNISNYKNGKNYNYYYKELSNDGKYGYIGIDKLDNNLYFCEIIYNYSKMEFYSDIDDLSFILANSIIIQKSIKYNDNLINVELDDNVSDGREVTYELDGPKDNKSMFSDYLQEAVEEEEEEVELPQDN